jgi:hypothetical protein
MSRKGGTSVERPKNGTHLSGLLRRGGFLTLLSKRTGTAMLQTGPIDHAHRAVALWSALVDGKWMPRWTV